MTVRVNPIVGLPTEFRGCQWDDGWEFDAPAAIYYPAKYRRVGYGNNTSCIDSMVDDICYALAVGDPVHDGGMDHECKWRGWSKRFGRRKNAWHVVIRVRWFLEDEALAWEIVGRREYDGPPNAGDEGREE